MTQFSQKWVYGKVTPGRRKGWIFYVRWKEEYVGKTRGSKETLYGGRTQDKTTKTNEGTVLHSRDYRPQ